MYLGIYISDSYITAATVLKNGTVHTFESDYGIPFSRFMVPLNLIVEDAYVYLGQPVDILASHSNDSGYFSITPNDLTTPYKIMCETRFGEKLNAIKLFSFFLDKLKDDIHLERDETISCATVCFHCPITSELISATEMAFGLSGISLCGVVTSFKPALMGYGIGIKSATEDILLYNLNPSSLSLGLFRVSKDGYSEEKFQITNEHLGFGVLKNQLVQFIVRYYTALTQKNIAKTYQNEQRILQMTDKVLYELWGTPKMMLPLVFAFDAPAIELNITKAHISPIIDKFCEEHFGFIKKCLADAQLKASDVAKVMVIGQPKVHPFFIDILKKVFQGSTEFFVENPEHVVTKGIALFANATEEREIASSLMAKAQKTRPTPIGEKPKLERTSQRFQINAGCTDLKN